MKTYKINKQIPRLSNKGFSIVEAIIAMIVLLVGLLGVFSVFTYAIIYNTGNNDRSQAMSMLQQEVEKIRSYRFARSSDSNGNPPIHPLLEGGGMKETEVTSADQSKYKVQVTIDDDPETVGIQRDDTKTLKEITVVVIQQQSPNKWQTSLPVRAFFYRTRSN